MTAASEPMPLGVTRRRGVHFAAYAVLLLGAVVAIPILSVVGARTLLDSRDGAVINPVLDPTQPGYQALVSPSPTLAVIHTDPTGALVGVAVLALAGEDSPGGSVLLIPPSTLAAVPEFGDLSLEYAQTLSGAETTFSLTEFILGLGIDDVVVVGHDTWAELIEPLGGLTIASPDQINAADGTVLFPAGELALTPEQVGTYLEVLRPGETPLNRMLRQELVWSAWLRALDDTSGQVVFPGEQNQGLARFVPSIAEGSHRIVSLPVTNPPVAPGPGDPIVFLPDDEAIAQLIPEIVPFPAGARPGDRPLVRVLDGSARPDVLAPAVRRVAVGGGQVVMIGNTDEFGETETQVLYSDPALARVAESVADALGVGSVQNVEYIDENAEIIVILGSDFAP